MSFELAIAIFLVLWGLPLVFVGWLVWRDLVAPVRRARREDREVARLDEWVPEGWSPEAKDLIRASVGGGYRL